MTLIFAVKDRAIDAFMQPFFAVSAGQAIRSFQDACNDGSTPMNKHPDDYDLYQLGDFDEETGQLRSSPTGAKQIAIGKNMVATAPTGPTR